MKKLITIALVLFVLAISACAKNTEVETEIEATPTVEVVEVVDFE